MSGERIEVDLGPADADITDPDVYTNGVPYATFERLRDDDPVSAGGTSTTVARASGPSPATTTCCRSAATSRRSPRAQGITLEEMDPGRLRRPPQHAGVRPAGAHALPPPGVEAVQPARGVRLREGDPAPRPLRRRRGARRSRRDVRLRRPDRQAAADAHARTPARRARRRRSVARRAGRCACWATSTPSSPSTRSASPTPTSSSTIPFRSPAALDLYRYAEQQAAQRRSSPDRRRDQPTCSLRRSTASSSPSRSSRTSSCSWSAPATTPPATRWPPA